MKKSSFDQNRRRPLFSELTTPEGEARLCAHLTRLMQCVDLDRKQAQLLENDFERLMVYYLQNGHTPEDIIQLLDAEKLGYFYYEKPERWYSLDTAATVYPLSMSRGWMPIFRLSAYLKETVVPEVLQVALTFVIRRFPYFSVTLGRGFFWEYLEETRRRFTVREESKRPFAVMSLSKFKAPCFRVVYYQNRISIEYFHLLTDGTGGTIFLKTLLGEYFRLLGKNVPTSCDLKDLSETPDPAEWADDFHLAEKTKASGFSGKRALQIRGRLSAVRPHQILHFQVDCEQLRATAKSKNATVTSLILCYLFFACKASVSGGKKRKIQIQVPCNMRKYYPSSSMRNFAMYCILCLHPDEVCDFDDVLARIQKELAAGTSKESLTKQMIAGTRLVASLKFIPMFLKAPITRLFYPLFSDRILTTTLSNLGVVTLPNEIADRVEKMDFVLGTTVSNRATCSMVTYQNKAVLSIFKATDHPAFEETLNSLLKKDGLTPIVTGSEANGFHRCLPEN